MEVITMNATFVRFPVTCPACSRESLARLSMDTILQSLATDLPLKLYAQCDRHAITWVANEVERNQIREYADAVHLSLSEKSNCERRTVSGTLNSHSETLVSAVGVRRDAFRTRSVISTTGRTTEHG
jgi:hypothetical protein